MSDIQIDGAPPSPLSRAQSGFQRWVSEITRDEINAFGLIALFLAVVIGAVAAFGLGGLITVYVALVPLCFVGLLLICVGG